VGAGGCRLIPLNLPSRWGAGALGVATIWLLSGARGRVQGWISRVLLCLLLWGVDLGRTRLSSNWLFIVLIAFFIRDLFVFDSGGGSGWGLHGWIATGFFVGFVLAFPY
jgi:hypothetical protein